MKKEDKGLIIGQLTEIVKEYPNFYLTDIEALDAEKTSKLRRECFKKEIKLVVVKNNLLKKALENVEGDFSPLQISRMWMPSNYSGCHTLLQTHQILPKN